MAMSFGPHGLGVMMPDINGLTISRIGSQILNIFDRGDSPIRDLIIKSANNFQLVTGDGLKTYFILLNSFFKNILKFKNNKAIIFKQLKIILNSINYLNSAGLKSEDFESIVGSFFYTRFTSPVAIILSNLFKKWISLNELIEKDKFTFLLDNFDALVYYKQNSFPLDESKIIKGVTLSGHYHGIFPKNVEQTILKVLYFCEDNTDDKTDVNAKILKILHDLQDVTDSVLLIVNNEIPSKSRHILRERRVNLFMHAEPETVKLLANYVQFYWNKHKTDPIIGFSCNILSYMTDLTLEISLYQLHICAPSKSYMKSYSKSFRDCLTLCRFILDTESPIIPAGQFEKKFAIYFTLVYNTEVDSVVPVKDYQELLKWHRNKEKLHDQLKTLCIVEKPTNLDEILINIILGIKSKCNKFDVEVVSIICEAMIEVTRRIPDVHKEIGYESLNLKIAILQRTLANVLMILNIDKILTCKKINCSLDVEDLEM